MNKSINLSINFLYTSLIIWILGITTIFIAYFFNPQLMETSQSPLLEKLTSFNPLFLLLFLIILIPLSEEFTFRYWTVQNKFSFYVSGLGMLFMTYFLFNNLVPFLILLIFLIAMFVFVKNKKKRLISMLIISSIVFSLMHLSNYSSNIIKIGAIIQLLGLALILSYIGIKFSFYYCIIGHSINNLIATIPLLMFAFNAETIQFENSTYKADLVPISIFSFSNEQSQRNQDSIIISGHITSIAVDLQLFNNDFLYTNTVSNMLKYKLRVIAKPDTSICFNQLNTDFLEKAKIQSDTTLKPAFTLSIFDTVKLKSKPNNNYFLMDLHGLVQMIRLQNNLPLKTDKNYENKTLFLDFSLLKNQNINDRKVMLNDKYGIKISEKEIDTIKSVKFYK